MIHLCKFTAFFESIRTTSPIVFTLRVNKTFGDGEIISLDHLPNNVQVFGPSLEDEWLRNDQVPRLYVRNNPSDLMRDICLREETEFEFYLKVQMPKDVMRNLRKDSGNDIFPFGNLKLKNYITLNGYESWSEENGCTTISGRINFRSHAGVVKFQLDPIFESGIVEAEVVSFKLDYESDFRVLLHDLADYHSELILQLDEPTEYIMNTDTIEHTSDQVKILHLRRLLEPQQLPLALETIFARPHTRINHEDKVLAIESTYRPEFTYLLSDPMAVNWRKGGIFSKYFKGFSPLELHETELDESIDTIENRYVKFVVEELESFILTLIDKLPKKYENSRRFLILLLEMMQDYLSHPFFSGVGAFTRISNSMVLQRRSGYIEVVKAIQSFHLGLQLESEINELDNIDGDLRPIHKLYEYWCFFKLLYVLRDICGQEEEHASTLISTDDKGFVLELQRGRETKVTFTHGGLRIELYYNRNFRQMSEERWEGTYDQGLYHPDFSILITSQRNHHWLHFDSKYKLDTGKIQRMLATVRAEEEITGNYKQNDIHTAHAYRDAILGSRGAYILYPDRVPHKTLFVRQPIINYRQTYSLPSIGAFPLKPGEVNQDQLEQLKEFLIGVFGSLSGTHYQEEQGIFSKDE